MMIAHSTYYSILLDRITIRNQYELFTRIRYSTIILFYAEENYFKSCQQIST